MTRREAAKRDGATRDERRGELLDAAIRLIRREGPLVSMTRIAAEAGVTKPMLYYHFGDRAGLYVAIASRFVGAAMGQGRAGRTRGAGSPSAQVEQRGRELVATMINAFFTFVEREPELYRFLSDGESQTGFVRAIGVQLAAVLEGFGVEAETAAVWGRATASMVGGVGEWWMQEHTVPRAHVVEHLTDLVWDGLGGAPGRPRPIGGDGAAPSGRGNRGGRRS